MRIDTGYGSDDEDARAGQPVRPSPSAPGQPTPLASSQPSPSTERCVTVHPDSGAVHGAAVVSGDGAGRGRRVLLRFVWRPADPLAVRIDVEARPDHPALPRGEWVVLRDFLRYGLETPTGDGDVHISPDGADARTVWLTLARRTRPCRLAVPAVVLTTFLDRTEAAVPCGEERPDAELDALIQALLRR